MSCFMDLKDLNESFALSSFHKGIHNTAFNPTIVFDTLQNKFIFKTKFTFQ